MNKILEWSGSLFALSGTILLSQGIPLGWLSFTISNFLLIPFAYRMRIYGIMTLNTAFLIFNLIGIWRFLCSS